MIGTTSKLLESATNVRGLLGNSMGRTPSASIAREIAVCIQQGRLFFEAAAVAPIQIMPLQIYYGVVAFAQAVIVARNGLSYCRKHPCLQKPISTEMLLRMIGALLEKRKSRTSC
jgi:hypothetical protein